MTEQTGMVTCKFPGCENPPEAASGKPGRPPEYCADRGHNPVTAWHERKRLADAERGITTSEAETDQPVTMARVTGAELLRQMRELAGTLAGTAERLTGAVATLGDPTAAEAEAEAVRAAAEERAVTAEAERADAERRGRRGPVKLRPEIAEFIRSAPPASGAALAGQVAERFGVVLHRRTIERVRGPR